MAAVRCRFLALPEEEQQKLLLQREQQKVQGDD